MTKTYYCIVTEKGREKLAAAAVSGEKLELPVMSVGDGAGMPVYPVDTQTALVREVWRGPTNALYLRSDDPETLIAEAAVPVDVGGWVAREVAIWDADGDAFAIGNFPATYKPLPEEGATQDIIARIAVRFSGTENVELSISPSVVIADRQWIIDNFLSNTGGATGDVLRKKSNQPNDVEWASLDIDGLQVNFDTREEVQELVESQTIVNWNQIVTLNAGFYVEGERLRPIDHYSVTSDTQIVLTSSYAAGTKIHGVQNDQAGSMTDATEALRGLATLASDGASLEGVSRALALHPAGLKYVIDQLKLMKAGNALSEIPLQLRNEARSNLGLAYESVGGLNSSPSSAKVVPASTLVQWIHSFGLGVKPGGAMPVVTDANDATTTGFYSLPPNASSRPGDGGWHLLVLRFYGGANVAQVAVSQGTDDVRFRRLFNGNWSAWRTLWSSGNITPVPTSRAIIATDPLSGGGLLSGNVILGLQNGGIRTQFLRDSNVTTQKLHPDERLTWQNVASKLVSRASSQANGPGKSFVGQYAFLAYYLPSANLSYGSLVSGHLLRDAGVLTTSGDWNFGLTNNWTAQVGMWRCMGQISANSTRYSMTLFLRVS